MSSLAFEQSFFRLVAEDLQALESVVLHELQHYDPTLVEAASHLMQAGGKRLRPVMVLLSALATGQGESSKREHHLLAMAVEVLHTATLIHDDIIDGANTRRGLPTVNHKWGLRTSVLTGDFLLARACYYISLIEKVRLNTIFSEMVMDMCNGEIRQLERRYNTQLNYEQYLDQVRSKTALLMAVGCQGAGIINSASEQQDQALYQYGHDVGIAFQIMDDILDFEVSEDQMGKSARNDLAQGQVTLPTLYALESQETGKRLRALIDDGLASPAALDEAFELVQASSALERCREEAQRYVTQAQLALASLPDSPAREALKELAEFAIQRSK